jgi:hypothetical protein
MEISILNINYSKIESNDGYAAARYFFYFLLLFM